MKSVDATISEKEKRAHELRVALAQVEADLKVLYRARELVGGEASIENVLPGTANEIMDLNRIIPSPESLNRLRGFDTLDAIQRAAGSEAAFDDYRREKDTARSAAWLETGCETWAEWAQATRGSTYNVFDVEYGADEYGTIYFSSVWTPIIPALVELSNAFPSVTLEVSFSDEGGYVIGKGTIKAGKKRITKHTSSTPEGRAIFESFRGEWFGPEGDDEDNDRLIDLSHKTAS